MLKVKNGFDNMQGELLVNNASQLLSKTNKDIINKKHQEYKSTKINSDDRDQIRLKLQEYYKKKTKLDENEDFATGLKSNHTSQIENEIQDHIEILGIEQSDLLAAAPMLQP